MGMNDSAIGRSQFIDAVRRFNRFYTRQIGVLGEEYLNTALSVTEARVLYELAHRERATASELCGDLGLDHGYLSRILQRFQRKGLLERTRSKDDGRQAVIRLTDQGAREFAALDLRTREQLDRWLSRLSVPNQGNLVTAMESIQEALNAPSDTTPSFTLRPHRSGDMGWIVYRNGVLYAQEFGWDEAYEALVASIVSTFLKSFNPEREHCWIAERGGETVGSVLCVQRSASTAQLRLLLVEPHARGLGIGHRLVDECVLFARRSGYRRIMLWTNGVLVAARSIYEQAGFRLVSEKRHHSFGKDLVGQNWELRL